MQNIENTEVVPQMEIYILTIIQETSCHVRYSLGNTFIW